jgi:hypothetical protein
VIAIPVPVEVLGWKLPSPEYAAVRLWLPCAKLLTEYDAWPLMATGTVAIEVVPSRKVIVPVRIPLVAEATCADRTIGLLKSWVVGVAESVTEVPAKAETDKALDVEPAKRALPE